jgi:hypothetical protein
LDFPEKSFTPQSLPVAIEEEVEVMETEEILPLPQIISNEQQQMVDVKSEIESVDDEPALSTSFTATPNDKSSSPMNRDELALTQSKSSTKKKIR